MLYGPSPSVVHIHSLRAMTTAQAAQPHPHQNYTLHWLYGCSKWPIGSLVRFTQEFSWHDIGTDTSGTGCNTGLTFMVPLTWGRHSVVRQIRPIDAGCQFWQLLWQHRVIGVFIICLSALCSPGTEWELWIGNFTVCITFICPSVCVPGSAKVRPMSPVTVRPGRCGYRRSRRWDLRNVSIDIHLIF